MPQPAPRTASHIAALSLAAALAAAAPAPAAPPAVEPDRPMRLSLPDGRYFLHNGAWVREESPRGRRAAAASGAKIQRDDLGRSSETDRPKPAAIAVPGRRAAPTTIIAPSRPAASSPAAPITRDTKQPFPHNKPPPRDTKAAKDQKPAAKPAPTPDRKPGPDPAVRPAPDQKPAKAPGKPVTSTSTKSGAVKR